MVVKKSFIPSSADQLMEQEERRRPDIKMVLAVIIALMIFFLGCVVGDQVADQRFHQDYLDKVHGENTGVRR